MDGKPMKKFVQENTVYREARELFIAFRAEGAARIVADSLTARV